MTNDPNDIVRLEWLKEPGSQAVQLWVIDHWTTAAIDTHSYYHIDTISHW